MRNLQKDLETCQRATPEPWEIHRNDVGDEYACIVPTEIYDSDGFPVVSYEGGLAPDCNWKAETIEANATFIAEAREGWPEAIKRAIEAEEEVATLKQELITTRSRLVDLEKALNLACAEIASFTDTCPLDLATKEFVKEIVQICLGNDCDNDIEKCWQEYLLKGARGKHE